MPKRIVALGGDGIGPEVVGATCAILEKMAVDLEIMTPLHGVAALEKSQNPFPPETRKLCDEADAVLFGAVEKASAPILMYLRWMRDSFANIRPAKYYPGVNTPLKNPKNIDMVIFRENSEGLYPPREGDVSVLAKALPDFRDQLGRSWSDYGNARYAIRVISENGVRRLAKMACQYALKRQEKGFPGLVSCITKSNVLRESCGLFDSVVKETVQEFPQLDYNHFHIDDACRRVVTSPQEFDVIVVSNMFGDILSDTASASVGGLGIVPSACVGERYAYFESVHGSAPDIAGKGIANPTATILSAAMMLNYLGLEDEAGRLEGAVAAVFQEGKVSTPDLGGEATTEEFTEAVMEKIAPQ